MAYYIYSNGGGVGNGNYKGFFIPIWYNCRTVYSKGEESNSGSWCFSK